MKILVAGDFCPCDRVAFAFERGNYEAVLGDVRKITSIADYSIVNFECPVVVNHSAPISKNGPNLCCAPNGIDAIKWAGFDCVTLANNHFRDYGTVGVADTILTLEEKEIDYVGGGNNIIDASRVLYKKIASQKLAIINCCENEFSIATIESGGSNPLNPIRQYKAIKEAREKADYVIVIVHGGHELFQLPSPRMVETYRFFIDAGADAVVNHHQHCYSGYELYLGKPIFYGLGNLCFDNPSLHSGDWTEGYAVIIDFSFDNPVFSLHPYCQCAEDAKVEFLPKDAFNSRLSELNEIIANEDCLLEKVNMYYETCASLYSSIFEPLYNRYFLAARFKGWLPSFIKKNRKLAAENYICCEAHRDKLMWWLKHN